MWVGSRRGIRVHSLEIFGALFFAVFVALGIIGSRNPRSPEHSTALIAVGIAVGAIAQKLLPAHKEGQ